MTPDPFWSNRFHWCALAAGFIAAGEDRLADALYVRELAYKLYEEGAFRDRVKGTRQTQPKPTARRTRAERTQG
jgi:hypothetical protein